MASPAESLPRRFSYADLATFPEDHLRREIIDGELVVNPAPVIRHQEASGKIHLCLMHYANETGGKAYAAPCDVHLAPDNVVEPDLIFVRKDHLGRIGKKFIEGAPDLVVEISSPSTRRLDLVRKHDLYERFGVPAYWFVDLEAERVEGYTLTDGLYGAPVIKYAGETIEAAGLPGLKLLVTEALAPEGTGGEPA